MFLFFQQVRQRLYIPLDAGVAGVIIVGVSRPSEVRGEFDMTYFPGKV